MEASSSNTWPSEFTDSVSRWMYSSRQLGMVVGSLDLGHEIGLSHFTVGFIPNRSIIQSTEPLRKHRVTSIESQSSPLPALEYSANGYIRLTYEQFCSLHFPRRLSFEDDDLRRELVDQAL